MVGMPLPVAVPSPRLESRLPCISSPASTSRTLAAPTAVADVVDDLGDPGHARVAARRLQLAVEVVRVQDRERRRAGRGGARGCRDREASSAATTSSRIGRERLTGAPPTRGHARGRSLAHSLSADQQQGMMRTLARTGSPAGHGRTSRRIRPDGHLAVAGARRAVHRGTGECRVTRLVSRLAGHDGCPPLRPSPSASPGSPRTSARPRPRRLVPCCASRPPGRGKTTTLVARVAWLVDGGRGPRHRSASSRSTSGRRRSCASGWTRRWQPLGVAAGSVRVRTFHALGREILRDAGVAVEPLADRDAVLRGPVPGHHAGGPRPAGPRVLAAQAGPARHRGRGGPRTRRPGRSPGRSSPTRAPSGSRAACDFDDLLVRALASLHGDAAAARPLARRARARLLVDEAQDLDRTQLELALLLAAPANDVFLVGDDDQTHLLAGGWPTCGGSSGWPPRCRACGGWTSRPTTGARRRSWPAPCGSSSTTASGSRSGSLPGSRRGGRLVLAPDAADDVVRVRRAMASWPADGTTRAVLARTNRELLVAVVAALDLGVPFRAPDLPLAIEDPRLGRTARPRRGRGRDRGRPTRRAARLESPPRPRPAPGRAARRRGGDATRRRGRGDRGRPRDDAAGLGGRPPVDRRAPGGRGESDAPASRICVATTRR